MEFSIEGNAEASWFAVFDGHGGGYTSKYAAEKILGFITATSEWKADSSSPTSIGAAMRSGFLTTDELLRAEPAIASGDDHSGSTAITAFITKTHIVVGNCGDSRAMLVRGDVVRGGAARAPPAAARHTPPPCVSSACCCCCSLPSPRQAVELSSDHKPYNEGEQRRIEAAGGTVTMRRVNGDLAVSRALGDFTYKHSTHLPATHQQVSPEPEIHVEVRAGQGGVWGGPCVRARSILPCPLRGCSCCRRARTRTSLSSWPATASGTS